MMPPLGQYIGLAAIGKSMMDTIICQRFLSRLAILIMLAVITGMLVGMVAAGIFYAAYILLVAHGLEPQAAFLTIGVGVAATAATAGALTISYVRKLRRILQPLSPFTSGVSDVANAFMDGLRTPPAHRPTD